MALQYVNYISLKNEKETMGTEYHPDKRHKFWKLWKGALQALSSWKICILVENFVPTSINYKISKFIEKFKKQTPYICH